MKPFIKWVGGKTQILPEVLALFPKDINNYYEPFLGGGSVLLGLLTSQKAGQIKITGEIYASDLNQTLIGLFKNVQTQPVELIKSIKRIIGQYESATGTVVNRTPATLTDALTSKESFYYFIRQKFNALLDHEKNTFEASAMFLFMNKTCFRGMYREGPNGFNVPFGNYKNPSIIDEEHILEVSRLIQSVIFRHQSYQDAVATVSAGDFVYVDPPYAPKNVTSFVGYNSDGFKLENHKHLFDECSAMKSKKARFLMSNADVPLVKEAFPVPSYCVSIISCKRSINSKNPSARENEVLITNM